MARLTTTTYWSEVWEGVKLPYLIDLRSYRWRCYDRILKRIVPRDVRMLEVGSGACQWLIYFSTELGCEVSGIDNAWRACRVGRRNLEITGVEGSLACADLFASPFRSQQFDIVFTDGVIEHFDDELAPLEVLMRHVKPGGLLITTVPNFAGWIGLVKRFNDPEVYRMHQPISVDDLRLAYGKLGLSAIDVLPFASFRVPFASSWHPGGWKGMLLNAFRLPARLLDKGLRSIYTATGRSIESRWLSAEIIAVGRVPISPSLATPTPGDEYARIEGR